MFDIMYSENGAEGWIKKTWAVLVSYLSEIAVELLATLQIFILACSAEVCHSFVPLPF